MRFCSRCLYPENHPLGILFDSEGVCSGCRVHEEKDALDWNERMVKLRRILDAYRGHSKSNYDCIVPVSGGRDSFFIVDFLKNTCGMNPLLVCYNKHYNSWAGIQNLSFLRTALDRDILTFTPNPEIVKELTRVTLERLGSMYWHCLAGHTVLPVRMAVGFKIPLVVWGAHQGLDQVGMFSHRDEVEMSRRYRKNHDLLGVEAEDFIGASPLLGEKDLLPYCYPHDKEIEQVGVRGIYLGNYIRWDSKAQHELMLAKHGYYVGPQQRTFDTYNDIDCVHYSGVHDYLKLLRCGFGKVTDHATREIRLGRLTRDQGIAIVQKYADVQPQDLLQLLSWIGMSASEFDVLCERERNPRLWVREKGGQWKLRYSIVDASATIGGLNKTSSDIGSTFLDNLPPQVEPFTYRLLTTGMVNRRDFERLRTVS